jgi:hypothetical protein
MIAGKGILTDRLNLVKQFRASPSPSGRRWREAPDEGTHTKTFEQACPHPALRAALSRRERDRLA